MSFFSRLFSKTPTDLLAKGDRYMESDSFFDARTCYEDGLKLCSAKDDNEQLKPVFAERVDAANKKLAECNLYEAEFAYSHGDAVKACDHLELAKTLTNDPLLREKAESLLVKFSRSDADNEEPRNLSSCASCAGACDVETSDNTFQDVSLPQHEYYELLIQQLPADQHMRYSELGEEFAHAYIAASRDEHQEALLCFESCSDELPQDIYLYEKAKVLHRLGNDREAEEHLKRAIQINRANSLAWINLALVLHESSNFDDALSTIETMINESIVSEQAQLLRAEIYESIGDHEAAVNQYVELLQSPYARAAAEKLYLLLMEIGRDNDAAAIYKKYLNKSCH